MGNLSTVDTNFLAHELNNLSVQEREKVFDEIHGVADDIQETDEFVAKSLLQMRQELSKIKTHKRKAYNLAVFLRPTLEKDDKLFLFFLRGERFDDHEAANKICLHYEHKLNLFGLEKLVKRITLDDLDDTDLQTMTSGVMQNLKQRDTAGRGIFIINPSKCILRGGDWKPQMRTCWYHFHSMLFDDVDLQRKGIVDVVYLAGLSHFPDEAWEFFRKASYIFSKLCFRRCGFHICSSSHQLRPVFSFLNMVMGSEVRLRQRSHFGSPLEIQYSLRAFGIAIDSSMSPDAPRQYLAERRGIDKLWRLEEADRLNECILYPNPHHDVLVGRGRPYQDCPGNLHMLDIINRYAELYRQSNHRVDKTVICIQVVFKIKEHGGRFLHRTEMGWERVDDDTARVKVGQALRFQLKQARDDSHGANKQNSKRQKTATPS